MAELDEILKRHTDPATGSIHGATFVAIDSQGHDIYRESFGSRKIDRSDPLTADTLTWIASQSKLVTSVAVMQLVEKGLVGLDDDVRKIVPALEDIKILVGFDGEADPAADEYIATTIMSRGKVDRQQIKPKGAPIYEEVKRKLTLRHLLTHSSGFAGDSYNPLVLKWSAYMGRTANTFDGTMAGRAHPLVFQPETSWEYGPSIDWAGKVVETITSQDLETYFQQHIWKPLNAAHTTFFPTKHFPSHEMPPLQETALRNGTSSLSPDPIPSLWPLSPPEPIGGAGLYGTANDYAKLLSCLLRSGSPLLSPSSVEELFRPQLSPLSKKALRVWLSRTGGDRQFRQPGHDEMFEVDHCLAGVVNMVDVNDRRKKGTVAWGGLPNLNWFVDREGGVAGTVFTQVMPPGDAVCKDLATELEGAVYRLKEGKKK